VNIDSTIGQDPGFSVDVANAGICGNNTFKTLTRDSSGHDV
jgi:hypothetical protein